MAEAKTKPFSISHYGAVQRGRAVLHSQSPYSAVTIHSRSALPPRATTSTGASLMIENNERDL